MLAASLNSLLVQFHKGGGIGCTEASSAHSHCTPPLLQVNKIDVYAFVRFLQIGQTLCIIRYVFRTNMPRFFADLFS
jgi:hypothetical protein